MRTAKIGPDLSLPLCQFISYFGFLRRLPLTTRFQTFNSLDNKIINSQSLSSFKKKLKIKLLSKYENSL